MSSSSQHFPRFNSTAAALNGLTIQGQSWHWWIWKTIIDPGSLKYRNVDRGTFTLVVMLFSSSWGHQRSVSEAGERVEENVVFLFWCPQCLSSIATRWKILSVLFHSEQKKEGIYYFVNLCMLPCHRHLNNLMIKLSKQPRWRCNRWLARAHEPLPRLTPSTKRDATSIATGHAKVHW